MSWQFTVGLRVKGKADRMVVDVEDALIAALKAKSDQPGATIMYAPFVTASRIRVSRAPKLLVGSARLLCMGLFWLNVG
jgi:hypothetical protein